MNRYITRFFITLAAWLTLGAGICPAAELSGDFLKSEAPVDVTADNISYDKALNTYLATGNVVIVQETTTLMADFAMLNMEAGVATAAGNVRVLDEGGNTLFGETLEMNLRDKTAVVVKGRLFYKEENIHITGAVIKKTGKESYTSKDTLYTTCDCDPGTQPAWSFGASTADVVIGDFLSGWNAVFYVKGVPVLYSPYLSVPIKRGRQTGFLQPKPGYSALRGLVLKNSFFWAISKNTDATFYLDYDSARGIGKALEYRYIRTRASSGEFYLYSYKENDIERVRSFRKDVNNLSRPLGATDDRWRMKWQHNEIFGDNINLRANIDLVSDDEYFIDFGKGVQERSLESIESNVSISRSWSGYNLVGQFRHFNNLLSLHDRDTLQRLPEISFTNMERRIGSTPLYLSSENTAVNFWRLEGVRGQRIDLHPRVSLPMSAAGYFDLKPSLGGRATFYEVTDHPNSRYFDRYLYDANVEMTTTFARVYYTDMNELTAIRNTVRPKLSYTYIPEAVQDDMPSFDSVDRVEAANSLTYSLNSTLTGRLEKNASRSYKNYAYLDLSQTYNIREATRELTGPTDKRRPLSEATGELIVNPADWTTLTAKGRYDVYEHWFTSYDASLGASDRRGDRLDVSYRFVRGGASYLEGSTRLKVIPSIDLTYLKRFSFDEYRSLETSYGVEYKHQCWDTVFTYTERLEEKIVFVTFNLKGLGKIAGIQGSIDQF
ncbi:MAG: LPS assembly protein LptD [Deltaproteobacteria bacterium]